MNPEPQRPVNVTEVGLCCANAQGMRQDDAAARSDRTPHEQFVSHGASVGLPAPVLAGMTASNREAAAAGAYVLAPIEAAIRRWGRGLDGCCGPVQGPDSAWRRVPRRRTPQRGGWEPIAAQVNRPSDLETRRLRP